MIFQIDNIVCWKLFPDNKRYVGKIIEIDGDNLIVKLFDSGAEILFKEKELEIVV